MSVLLRSLVAASVLLGSGQAGWAQTAAEVLERSVTAMGGRAAFSNVKSRSTIGTITLSTPGGEVTGSVDVLNAVPNKSRSLIQIDLSSLGAGQYVLDTRFDGTSGYVLDNLQGNRDMSGNQLDNMRNASFPHSFLNYKELGTTAQLGGREKVGEREAYLVVFEPTSGSVVRQYLDAETYLPVRTVVKVDVPQLGREIEQTTDYSDYREVDGLKLPFRLAATSSVQSYTITVTKVEHNISVDEKLFAKPNP
jgi:zinc protease